MARTRILLIAAAAAVALALGACGGDEDPAVGDCIDSESQVVACDSSEADMELVSDLDAPDAIACIVIDDPPQEEVAVGDGSFCAEPLD